MLHGVCNFTSYQVALNCDSILITTTPSC